jgi:type II secretory pathway pseudopilin PulG
MRSPRSVARAFSLVEITLALGVAAISLVAIFGLLVSGAKTHATAVEQSSSSDILTAVVADLRATLRTSTSSPQFNIPLAGGSPSYFNALCKSSSTWTTDSRYQLSVTPVGNQTGREATFLNVKLSWPAKADPNATTTNAIETFVALDRN